MADFTPSFVKSLDGCFKRYLSILPRFELTISTIHCRLLVVTVNGMNRQMMYYSVKTTIIIFLIFRS